MVWILPVSNDLVNSVVTEFSCVEFAVNCGQMAGKPQLRARSYGRTLSRTGIVGIPMSLDRTGVRNSRCCV
jgi:hypothetical protein